MSDSIGVDWTRTPERHQGEPARIRAPFREVDLCGPRHILAHDLENTDGRVRHAFSKGFAEPVRKRARRGLSVELHRTPKEVVGVEIAKYDIGVGNGGLFPTKSVASRPGICPSTRRSHFQQTHRIDLGYASTSGPDFDHVDDRDLDRQPAPPLEAVDSVSLKNRRQSRTPGFDETDLCCGAAHIEGDYVGVDTPGQPTVVRSCESTRGRAGFDNPDRVLGRRIHRREAAA